MPRSKVVYYEGSQLPLDVKVVEDPDNWGLLRTPISNMKRQGIVRTVVDMPTGGYTIIDSRLGWTCEQGIFMNVGFGMEEEVASWDKMPLPDTETLRAKVAELEAGGFRTHFSYDDILTQASG